MTTTRRGFLATLAALPLVAKAGPRDGDWPMFRGPGGRGVADGFKTLSSWDLEKKQGLLWRTDVPGLGHSSPVIWGDRMFVPTSVSSTKAPLTLGRTGEPTAADDNAEQRWVVLCYDKKTGGKLWQHTAHEGAPRASRHVKATHANTTLATDGRHLVAFFGSEGLHCYNLDGRLLWTRDLGVINVSKYGIGWGFGSSPSIHDDRVVVLCDAPAGPFVAAFQLSDGRELWRLPGGGDNPIPTPFSAHGWIFVTNAHGGQSPIFAVRPEASGDLSVAPQSEAVVWSAAQGGSYISTPVVYGDHIYLGNTNGVLRCFESKTGKKVYEERLGAGASIYSSLVAADGKIYCGSENGVVYVVKAGPTFEVLARNALGDPYFATPAVSGGVIFFRTASSLLAIGG